MGGGQKSSDPTLTKLLGEASLEEFLLKEDAWPRIIQISQNLWGKQISTADIQGLIQEYEDKKELENRLQRENDAKYHESDGLASDGEDGQVMVKAVANKVDTHSSNEIVDDYYEYMTAEISPSK